MQRMSDQIINCHLHDYIEIACLYSLKISITLGGGEKVNGTAITTQTAPDKKEYLVINPEGKSGEKRIELIQIRRLQALTANPHFDCIEF